MSEFASLPHLYRKYFNTEFEFLLQNYTVPVWTQHPPQLKSGKRCRSIHFLQTAKAVASLLQADETPELILNSRCLVKELQFASCRTTLCCWTPIKWTLSVQEATFTPCCRRLSHTENQMSISDVISYRHAVRESFSHSSTGALWRDINTLLHPPPERTAAFLKALNH